MNYTAKSLILLLLHTFPFFLIAQDFQQTIKGIILDKDSQTPLIGASISINSTESILGTTTDLDGYYKIENIPIGRHNLEISYLGYKTEFINSVLLSSGKELVLNVDLSESTEELMVVEVSAESTTDKTKPLNEMATVSARTFSVEETSRYAASLTDPARMAQNYAGVSTGSTDDLSNEIVIRGNSPSGVMWRLEGIEIPNPNHFSDQGNSGGGISMLSSSTLSNSDFFTGAFPSEYGNALSGVFDLKLRNGNNEKREHAFKLGLLGVELATEGPFSKNSKASYLFNYRYSTLALIEKLGLSPTGDILPAYQDLSFKINIPNKKLGNFSIFGIGGSNGADVKPDRDSLTWVSPSDKYGFKDNQLMGTIGISNKKLLSNNSYLHTIVMGSFERHQEDDYLLDIENNLNKKTHFLIDTKQTTFRISSTFNKKFNAKNSIRTGIIYGHNKADFRWDGMREPEQETKLINYFNNEGTGGLIQAFGQWKHKLNDDLIFNAGIHFSQMTFNNKFSIEPRTALQWNLNEKQTLSASIGLHSKMEHLNTYLFEGTFLGDIEINNKKNLGLSKSLHSVIAYDHVFNPNLRFKGELYFQHLFDIPVEDDPNSNFSLMNAVDIWDMISKDKLVNEGTGRNIGIDLTLEKFFSQQYYFLITCSLYDSKFKAKDGKAYNTTFNGNYQFNVLGGKEFKVGKKKKNILGINMKNILSGGNRITPIDLEASIENGHQVSDFNNIYKGRAGIYYRTDIGLSYLINTKKRTHSIILDIQNVTNRQNVGYQYYDAFREEIVKEYQTGLFPVISYKIEF